MISSALYRRRLHQKRAATTQRIASLTQSFDEIVRATTGEAIDDEHDPEGHTIAWERQQIAALLDEARSSLAEVADAEGRLDAGTYGVCLECGNGIASARLDALPATATCVACAA